VPLWATYMSEKVSQNGILNQAAAFAKFGTPFIAHCRHVLVGIKEDTTQEMAEVPEEVVLEIATLFAKYLSIDAGGDCVEALTFIGGTKSIPPGDFFITPKHIFLSKQDRLTAPPVGPQNSSADLKNLAIAREDFIVVLECLSAIALNKSTREVLCKRLGYNFSRMVVETIHYFIDKIEEASVSWIDVTGATASRPRSSPGVTPSGGELILWDDTDFILRALHLLINLIHRSAPLSADTAARVSCNALPRQPWTPDECEELGFKYRKNLYGAGAGTRSVSSPVDLGISDGALPRTAGPAAAVPQAKARAGAGDKAWASKLDIFPSAVQHLVCSDSGEQWIKEFIFAGCIRVTVSLLRKLIFLSGALRKVLENRDVPDSPEQRLWTGCLVLETEGLATLTSVLATNPTLGYPRFHNCSGAEVGSMILSCKDGVPRYIRDFPHIIALILQRGLVCIRISEAVLRASRASLARVDNAVDIDVSLANLTGFMTFIHTYGYYLDFKRGGDKGNTYTEESPPTATVPLINARYSVSCTTDITVNSPIPVSDLWPWREAPLLAPSEAIRTAPAAARTGSYTLCNVQVPVPVSAGGQGEGQGEGEGGGDTRSEAGRYSDVSYNDTSAADGGDEFTAIFKDFKGIRQLNEICSEKYTLNPFIIIDAKLGTISHMGENIAKVWRHLFNMLLSIVATGEASGYIRGDEKADIVACLSTVIANAVVGTMTCLSTEVRTEGDTLLPPILQSVLVLFLSKLLSAHPIETVVICRRCNTWKLLAQSSTFLKGGRGEAERAMRISKLARHGDKDKGLGGTGTGSRSGTANSQSHGSGNWHGNSNSNSNTNTSSNSNSNSDQVSPSSVTIEYEITLPPMPRAGTEGEREGEATVRPAPKRPAPAPLAERTRSVRFTSGGGLAEEAGEEAGGEASTSPDAGALRVLSGGMGKVRRLESQASGGSVWSVGCRLSPGGGRGPGENRDGDEEEDYFSGDDKDEEEEEEEEEDFGSGRDADDMPVSPDVATTTTTTSTTTTTTTAAASASGSATAASTTASTAVCEDRDRGQSAVSGFFWMLLHDAIMDLFAFSVISLNSNANFVASKQGPKNEIDSLIGTLSSSTPDFMITRIVRWLGHLYGISSAGLEGISNSNSNSNSSNNNSSSNSTSSSNVNRMRLSSAQLLHSCGHVMTKCLSICKYHVTAICTGEGTGEKKCMPLLWVEDPETSPGAGGRGRLDRAFVHPMRHSVVALMLHVCVATPQLAWNSMQISDISVVYPYRTAYYRHLHAAGQGGAGPASDGTAGQAANNSAVNSHIRKVQSKYFVLLQLLLIPDCRDSVLFILVQLICFYASIVKTEFSLPSGPASSGTDGGSGRGHIASPAGSTSGDLNHDELDAQHLQSGLYTAYIHDILKWLLLHVRCAPQQAARCDAVSLASRVLEWLSCLLRSPARAPLAKHHQCIIDAYGALTVFHSSLSWPAPRFNIFREVFRSIDPCLQVAGAGIDIIRHAISFLTAVMINNDPGKEKFHSLMLMQKKKSSSKAAGAGAVQSPSRSCNLHDLCDMVVAAEGSLSMTTVQLFLDMLLDGRSLESKAEICLSDQLRDEGLYRFAEAVPLISNTTALPVLFALLPQCDVPLQKFLLNTLKNLIMGHNSVVNMSKCSQMHPPLIDVLLDAFLELHPDSHAVAKDLIQTMGRHNISVSQLKRIFGLMQSLDKYRPACTWRLLSALQGMVTPAVGPKHYILFEGKDSGLTLPPVSLPVRSAYSFSMWFCVDSQHADRVRDASGSTDGSNVNIFLGLSAAAAGAGGGGAASAARPPRQTGRCPCRPWGTGRRPTALPCSPCGQSPATA
jgi:hypothetical protein